MAPAAVAAPTPAVAAPIKPSAAPATGVFQATSLFVSDKLKREAAARSLASQAKNDGPAAYVHAGLAEAVVKALNDKKSPASREGAAHAIAICMTESPKALEPIIVEASETGVFNTLLETLADKMPAVKTAAFKALKAIVSGMNPWATAILMPLLLKQIKTNGKWQVKQGACQIIDELVAAAPVQVAKLSPDIVPVLADAIWDTKAEVKKAAKDCLTKTTSLVSNKGERCLEMYN